MKNKFRVIAIVVMALIASFSGALLGCSGNGGSDKENLGFKLSETYVTINEIGQTHTLTATMNGKKVSNVVWEISNPGIATVENGVVTAVSNGIAEVSASYGDKVCYCVVYVNHEEVLTAGLNISFSQTEVQINPAYQNTYQIVFSVTKELFPIETKITWQSSNTAVATVDGNGLVTAVSKGQTVVTGSVSYGGDYAQAQCVISVADNVDLLFGVDSGVVYTTDVIDLDLAVKLNGQESDDLQVSYYSDDISIATVDTNGIVKPKKAGKVTIFATCGEYTNSVDFTVVEKHFIYTAEDFLTIGQGNSEVIYELKNNVDLSEITWANNGDKYFAVEKFNGTLDGNGHKIRYTYDAPNTTFRGIIGEIAKNATVKNLAILGTVTLHKDWQSSLFGSVNGTLSNCYVDLSVRLTASSSGNWLATISMLGGSGTIKDCIIKNVGYAGARVDELQFSTAFTGTFENVAYVSPKENPSVGWSTGLYNARIKDSSLVSLYAYTDLFDIVSGAGVKVSNPDGSKFVYTAMTEKQTFGETWGVTNKDVTLCGKSVLLYEYYIETSEQLLKMGEGGASSMYILTKDIDLGEVDPITYEGTLTYIAKFSGILDGNGHKITYSLTAPDNMVSISGLFYEISSTAVIKNLRLYANIASKKDYSYGLCNINNGTISDCYFKLDATMSESASGNYLATITFMWRHEGKINDCIFDGYGVVNENNKRGLSVFIKNESGTLDNVAYMARNTSGEMVVGYKSSLYSGFVPTSRLTDVRVYVDINDFINENGKVVNSDGSSYTYVAAQGKQEFSDAWAIKDGKVTLLNQNIINQ